MSEKEKEVKDKELEKLLNNAISQPLVKHCYTADPSAHLFEGKIYIYPSHDIEAGIPFDDLGNHFAMKDYHVFSMESIDGSVTDHGVVLDVKDVVWAQKQMWAPDAAEKDGNYYLFFPAKDHEGIFRIGVAVGNSPYGPFVPQPSPIKDSFSIDPAVFKDDDNAYYMYFGGLWGGQLQRWRTGTFIKSEQEAPFDYLPEPHERALCPRIAKMRDDLLGFAEPPKEVVIIDENGNPLLAGDNDRRYFEGPWMHKYKDKYYFSYSTGDTHRICYAIGDSPYGPFTYKGVILNPVIGWTTHHSIIEIKGKWYLFYHDSSLSGGITHLRCIKLTEINYNEDGTIQQIFPYA